MPNLAISGIIKGGLKLKSQAAITKTVIFFYELSWLIRKVTPLLFSHLAERLGLLKNPEIGIVKIPQLLIKADEAAKLLSISKRKLWSLTQEGTILCVRIGTLVFYCPRYLANWIDQEIEEGGLI